MQIQVALDYKSLLKKSHSWDGSTLKTSCTKRFLIQAVSQRFTAITMFRSKHCHEICSRKQVASKVSKLKTSRDLYLHGYSKPMLPAGQWCIDV